MHKSVRAPVRERSRSAAVAREQHLGRRRGVETLLSLEWRQATGKNHLNGSTILKADGGLVGEWTGMDSDKLKITEVRLGLPSGSKGANGSFFVDLFRSAR